ncbi:MAG TPA: hypothetical protein VGN12_10220 [Pirellulales bacterium]|jgi:mono/diheme cytochrome c family protein
MSIYRLSTARGETHRIGHTARWRTCWLFAPFTVAILSLTACAQGADDDDAIAVRVPGLLATYAHPASGVEFTRYEAAPAILLAAAESPDPRLPATGWHVTYSGVIEILRPGDYRFDAVANGKLSVSIAGRPVALRTTNDQHESADASPAVPLELGLQPFELTFEPSPNDAARLQIYWKSESFEPEPLPSRALGHETSAPTPSDTFRQARLSIEDHNCIACHRANEQLPLSAQIGKRPAPRLTGAGARLKAGWIYHWLADPAALRTEAVMPRLFAAAQHGDVERYAVATYLAGQNGPIAIVPDAPTDVIHQSAAEGAQLFQRIGCAVCHEKQGERPARVTLRALAQKTTPEAIEAFLQKPDAVAPAGRMPTFVLGKLAKRQLAMYLISHDAEKSSPLELPAAPTADAVQAAYAAIAPDAAVQATFAKLSADEQLTALGRQVMRSRNCAACHEFKQADEKSLWEPAASRHDFLAIAKQPAGGCMTDDGATADRGIPRFGASLDRKLVTTFLHDAISAPATRAPADDAALALAKFNCTACHERDGLAGLTPEYINRLGSGEDAASELVTPPSLTQVTAKLTERALRGVLEADERSRPWMSLQMPQFGKARLSTLPPQLAALDATVLTDEAKERSTPKEPSADEQADTPLAEAGRTLVGSRGFGCTKCHDMLGVPSSGTRGPDLANVTARVRHPWYLRWMHDPQRIQAGTRMPTVFLNGESPYKDILAGDPARQREAIWSYLALAKSLPPPEGLEEKKLQTLAADNFPVVIRTFLPGTTPRGLAIRYPNEVHAAFDAQMARVAFAWSGEFLDLGPVWNGRGGHQARILGKIFWSAPPGCPWDIVSTDTAPPTFAGRADDPIWGALVKDSKLHPSKISLAGYRVDNAGPTLRYNIALDGGERAAVSERLTTTRKPTAESLVRELRIAAPATTNVWLFASESETAPQSITAQNSAALQDGEERAADQGAIRIEQDGHPILLHLRSSTGGAQWIAQKSSERWHLLLKLTPPSQAAERTATLSISRAPDGEPDAWQRLVAEELK